MSNDYFDTADYTAMIRNTLARAESVNNAFSAVEAGFDKLPDELRVKQGRVTYAQDTGAANAYVVALPHAPSAYVAGLSLVMKAAHANTAASTLNVSALGVKPIKRYDGTDVASGDILAGALVHLAYDGTNFRIIGANGAEAASSQASAQQAQASASAAAASEVNAAASASAAAASETAAAVSESAAAASASSAFTDAGRAEAAANSVIYSDVVYKSAADSPITLTGADKGKLLVIDASGGPVSVTLPAIGALNPAHPWTVSLKKADVSSNAITVNRAGTDTIDGDTASARITMAEAGMTLVADTDRDPDDWSSVLFGARTGTFTVDEFEDGADFTGGVSTALTLSVGIGNKNNTWVFFDGVHQAPSGYTVAGTALSFDSAIPSGVGKVTVISGMPLSVGTPTDGTVTVDEFEDGADFTGGVSTALTLSVGIGNKNNTWVFFDGVHQAPSGYTVAGTALSFDSAIPGGVGKVTVISGITLIGTPGDGTVTDGSVAPSSTLYHRIHDFINVRDPEFGALGDGLTDDTAAIQAAIDFAANKGGGDVWFPAGSYLVSDTLEVSSDRVGLIGESGAAIVQASDFGDVIYVHGSGSAMVKLVTLSGLTIENTATVTSGAAIRIEGCVRSWFKDLYIHNTFKGITLSAVGACWFTDIYMLADDAMAYTGRSQFETNRFAAGTYPNNGVANVFLSGVQCTSPPSSDRRIENSLYIKESDGIWISNSYFGWALNNITFETTAATVLFNYVFLSNVMSDGGGTAGAGYNIRFRSSGGTKTIAKCGLTNVNCEGGALKARGCYIQSSAKVHGVAFSNCLFAGAYAEGFIIEAGASAAYIDLSNCTARANGTRPSGTSPGIAILDGDHITITGGSSGGEHASSVAGQSYGIVTSEDATNVRISGVNLANNVTAPLSAAPSHRIVNCSGGGESSTVASASIIPPPLLSDIAYVTGTTGIANINASYNGRRITLVFAGELTVTDGGNLRLAGDFATTANDSLSLVYSSDANAWVETGRSAN